MKSGGSRGNTLTQPFQNTVCREGRIVVPALCFPRPSEPESFAAFCSSRSLRSGSEVKGDGKQETASPKGKSSPGPSQCEGCSMPAFDPSCAKRYLRLMGSVGVLSRSVEQCKGNPKCWVETYLVTSSSHVLCGWPWNESMDINDTSENNSNANRVPLSEIPPSQKLSFLSHFWQRERADPTSLTVECRL